MVDKGSEQYLIDSTKNALDLFDFDGAIANITPVLVTHPTDETVAYLAANAYAGRAGLRSLDVFTEISGSSSSLLLLFAKHMRDATATTLTDMDQAATIIENYGATPSLRSGRVNFFAVLLYLARAGAYLNYYGIDPVTNSVRSNFTACVTTKDFAAAGPTDVVGTGIPNADIDTIMVSVAKALDSLSHANLSGAVATALTSFSANPAITPILAVTSPLPCTSVTVPPVPSGNQATCLAFRAVVNNAAVGLGQTFGVAGDAVCPSGVTP